MSFTEICGHLANIGFLYGAWALANRKLSGWWAQIWANSLYAIQAYFMNNSPLLIVSIVLIGVNIYGFYSWTKQKKPAPKPCNFAEHSYLLEVLKHYDGEE